MVSQTEDEDNTGTPAESLTTNCDSLNLEDCISSDPSTYETTEDPGDSTIETESTLNLFIICEENVSPRGN